jgi:hypothetical protein
LFTCCHVTLRVKNTASRKWSEEHYIEPDEAVNPVTAEILEFVAQSPSEVER